MIQTAALVLIVGTLIGVAVGRYPWLCMNRATIAFAGASMVSSPMYSSLSL